MILQVESGSFRDPGGRVFLQNNRVYRGIFPSAVEDFKAVRRTPLIPKLIEQGLLLAETEVDAALLADIAPQAVIALEHPRLPFISYPYEWSFAALKAAALLTLDIYLQALQHGVTLSDASAYNVQFIGTKPIFIDHLSFRPYRDGMLWMGHRQFCEQFLNPLLLRAYGGITHHSWYRGQMQGISAQDLRQVLPAWRLMMPKTFMHVFLQSSLQKTTTREAKRVLPKIHLPLTALQGMLQGLRNWISKLEPKAKNTAWQHYAKQNSYSSQDSEQKAAMVAEFVNTVKPSILWDLGCNTGVYSQIALQNGVQHVIGFDADINALEQAWQIHSNLLPLYQDLSNPSPQQGWRQRERYGLQERGPADALLALALIHHLAIAQNIPLANIAEWLCESAPCGLIEFVPKTDAMVQELLRLREDVFADYTLENFLNALQNLTKIHRVTQLKDTGRYLVWYGQQT